jgi:hypothetical protein
MNAVTSENRAVPAMGGTLGVTLTTLDFVCEQVAARPISLEATTAIKALRQHIEKLGQEAVQQSVQQATVEALLEKLTLAIARTLQTSSRIELLAPGLSIEMALIEGQFDCPILQGA